jgi:hypothetical protein
MVELQLPVPNPIVEGLAQLLHDSRVVPAVKMSNPQTYQFPSKTIKTDYPVSFPSIDTRGLRNADAA